MITWTGAVRAAALGAWACARTEKVGRLRTAGLGGNEPRSRSSPGLQGGDDRAGLFRLGIGRFIPRRSGDGRSRRLTELQPRLQHLSELDGVLAVVERLVLGHDFSFSVWIDLGGVAPPDPVTQQQASSHLFLLFYRAKRAD
jgi:hypothetical protein